MTNKFVSRDFHADWYGTCSTSYYIRAFQYTNLLLREEILHQLIGRISHDLQGPRFLSSQVVQDFFHQKYDEILWYAAQEASITSYILIMPVLTSPSKLANSRFKLCSRNSLEPSTPFRCFKLLGFWPPPFAASPLGAWSRCHQQHLDPNDISSKQLHQVNGGGVQGALLLSCVHFARNQAFRSSQIQRSKPICPPKVLSEGFLHEAQKVTSPPWGQKKWSGPGLMPPCYEPWKKFWWGLMYAHPVPQFPMSWDDILVWFQYEHLLPLKIINFQPHTHSVWEQHFGIHDLNLVCKKLIAEETGETQFPFNWLDTYNTPRKINMEPENTPLETENHLPNHHFQVLR